MNPMKITISTERWCDLNPELGNTSSHSNIMGSLRSTGIHHDVFFYDEYLKNNSIPIDSFLIDHVKNTQPDLLLASYYPFMDYRNVKTDTFREIRDLGTPVVFLWFDFVHQIIKDTVMKVYDAATLNVVVDVYEQPNDKFLPMWVPQDEALFNPNHPKDIDVSFVGSRNGYLERHHYLSFLPTVQISGGQREHKLTIEQYAEILSRSKTTLNFPSKQDGCIQAKSRIYEAMLSGAMLLEKENDCITRWFEPMVHYVPFVNEQDMVDKVDYYVANGEERQKIADQAYQKMKTDYNGMNWWMTVFNEAKKHI